MLGSIIGIEENTVLIKPNIDLTKFDSLVNLHVIMEHSDKKIVGEIARATGANGGGRPNFAQGGIKDSSKLEEVLAKIESEVKE